MNSISPTADQVLEALSTVFDPDLKKDLVSLKMVQDVQVDAQRISFTLYLTTPACPLREQLEADCRTALDRVFPQYPVDIKMDVRKWEPKAHRPQPDGIGSVILVLSGKGGVGKSTVAAGLARSLSDLGAQVALLDADIHGPSQPTLWNLQKHRPPVVNEKMRPIECGGVSVLSLGMLIDPGQPLVWRGPMAGNALKQLVSDTDWGMVDYLVIDMPPGTGDVQLTLSQLLPDSYAVLVTTPHLLSVADARKAGAMCRMESMRIRLVGVVENMSWFAPAHRPDERYYLFGQGGGVALAQEYKVPLLAQLPLLGHEERQLANSGNTHTGNHPKAVDLPVADKPQWQESPFKPYFQNMSASVARAIAVHQATSSDLLSNSESTDTSIETKPNL
jgi:ATP-binding protein involved in chromosome partitioning